MDRALGWLRSRYRKEYLTWPHLREALDDWDSGACEFDNFSSTTQLRGAYRSGFRTFLRDTIGDASIAFAVLRNGYATADALKALVREIFQARQKAKTEREAKPPPFTRKSHPGLAAAATEARKEYVAGKKLAHSIEDRTRKSKTLESWEWELYQRFSSGRLERENDSSQQSFRPRARP